jgi:hypothetical protein
MSRDENNRTGGNTISFLRIFLFIILALLLIRVLFPLAPHQFWMLLHRKAKARSVECSSRLTQAGQQLYATAKEKDPAALAGLTVADLLRDAMRGGKLDESMLRCPAHGEPYFVFSTSAEEFVRLFETRRVNDTPVLMCPRGHRIFGINILYSDGRIITMTEKGVNKFLSGQPREQIKLPYEATAGQGDPQTVVQPQ